MKINKKQVWELFRFALLAIIIVLPIRIFIAQPFIVAGASMYPTLENGEYLIIDEISYRFQDPKRYDVIVFRYPENPKKFFIKRIIALPNEKIKIENGEIIIINQNNLTGFKLKQDYIKNKSFENMEFKLLKEDEYFVIGDNRIASYDSRSWGPVSKKLIIGKSFLRLLPLNKISFKPGEIKN